ERTRVEERAAPRLPPAVLVQAVELRPGLELVEGAREVRVAEDDVRLERLVGAADQHRLRVLADELDTREVVDDGVHRQREDTLAGEGVRGRDGRRLEL